MSIVGLPLILFQAEEEADMGDVEYLARIAFGDLSTGSLVNLKGSGTATFLVGTVPVGKDWYLAGWNGSKAGTGSGKLSFEYPTGTIIEFLLADTIGIRGEINGVSKGNKITSEETITATILGASTTAVNVQVIEVDTGVSPEL